MADTCSITPAIRSPLLSDIDAARYLLLTEGRSDKAGVKALNRIVDSGRLRPALIGKYRRYCVRELDRFIDAMTEQYAELP